MNVKSLLMAVIFAAGMQVFPAGPASAVEYSAFDGEFVTATGAPGGDLSITELFIPGPGGAVGSYNVTNNTDLSLAAFGVSNTGTTAFVGNIFNQVDVGFDDQGNMISYRALTLNENAWTSQFVQGFNLPLVITYAGLFGDFASNADGGDTINWYYATPELEVTDPLLGSGRTSPSGFFLFAAFLLQSKGLGILSAGSDQPITLFNNLAINTISAVPVPAALPLFGTGLAVMGFIGWRRKRKLAA